MAKPRLKRKIFTAIAFFFLFIGLMVFLFSGDNFEVLKELFNNNLTKDEIQTTLGKLGYKGYITIGILSMLQVVLTFLPAEPVQVMSGVAFGLWKGGLICLTGVFVGNIVIFILYKIYGDKLNDYFHKNAEFDFDAARNSPKVALVVFILYFLPAIPYGLICFFTASLNTKFPKYIVLTTLGSIPSILIGVGLGHIAIAASWAISFLVLGVLVTLLILLYRYKSQVFKKVNEFMKNKQAYSSKTIVKKQNFFLYRLCAFLSIFVFDPRLKLRLKNNVGKLEKPSIVICNHGSFLDFVYAGRLLKKEQPRFVTARMYFFHKTLGTILRKVGCFPKSMFTADIENAKNCLRVLSSNGTLVMMPEARLSTVGKYEGVQDTTYRFLQKMGVAVYVIQMRGDFFAKPKWGDKMRKGARVEAELSPLFAAGETKTLTLDEVKRRVDEALYYDEFEWLKQHPKDRYKSKTLAKGLENVLCLCPECRAKSSMQTQGRKVYCEACGFERTMDDRYAFTTAQPFENFADWYAWQTQEMEKEVRENPDFKLESKVQLFHACKGGKKMLQVSGEGVCVLDKAGLTYKGTENGREIEKCFPLADLYRILFGAGEDFEVYEGDELYYFVPENKRSCIAWYIASGVLKNVY